MAPTRGRFGIGWQEFGNSTSASSASTSGHCDESTLVAVPDGARRCDADDVSSADDAPAPAVASVPADGDGAWRAGPGRDRPQDLAAERLHGDADFRSAREVELHGSRATADADKAERVVKSKDTVAGRAAPDVVGCRHGEPIRTLRSAC